MRFLMPVSIAGFLLTAGLLVGCKKQPLRMKNQPTNLNTGGIKTTLPGKKKVFEAGQ